MTELLMVGLGSAASGACSAFWNSTTLSDTRSDIFYRGPQLRRTPRLVAVEFAEGSTIQREWKLDEDDDDVMEEDGLESNKPQQATGSTGDADGEASRDESSSAQRSEEVAKAEKELFEQQQPKTTTHWKSIVPKLHQRSRTLLSDARCKDTQGLSMLHYYPQGTDESVFQIDEVFENIRYFTEECDSGPGCVFVVDAFTAFGSMAETLLTKMQDDMGKLSTLLFAIHTTPDITRADPDKVVQQYALNRGFGTIELAQLSSAYIPITVPTWDPTVFNHTETPLPTTQPKEPHSILHCDTTNILHTSTVIASAIDTLLLPTKLPITNNQSYSLGHICSALRTYKSMSVSSLFCSCPLPLYSTGSDSLATILENNALFEATYLPLTHPWMPAAAEGAYVSEPQVIAKTVSLRGTFFDKVPVVPKDAKLNAPITSDEVVENYCNSVSSMRTLSTTTHSNYALSGTTPLAMFPEELSPIGWVKNKLKPDDPNDDVYEVSTASVACTTTGAHGMLAQMAKEFKQIPLRLFHGYGRGQDDWMEARNDLDTLADEYVGDAAYLSDDDGSGISD
eukprot:TRINITY_DN27176_c0_g1_i1.p1 TRINITY_DN27176_c0_g1~~TRINITY_DN27176_c0_g1_i1.p1  ORF type:complete len:566 (+),score=67.67 TRINITY_DN27176_c0_g1_i1:74-1771(+)